MNQIRQMSSTMLTIKPVTSPSNSKSVDSFTNFPSQAAKSLEKSCKGSSSPSGNFIRCENNDSDDLSVCGEYVCSLKRT
ncbi:hypothetical protein TNCT_588821 [Trichonephila clavata]|uniref:Uncharacterized protein n=1 Tax=Trichonephila clavata TaxID=2740835 RepID=A0A8X6J7U4_TRICU|nr:hypothetical protein TNCT_588821 [Trichonephila clavata]